MPQQQQFDYEMNDNSHENKENYFYEDSDKLSWSEKDGSSASTSDINSLDDDVLIKDFKEFIKKNLTNKSEKQKSNNNRQVSLQSTLELNQINKIDIQQIGFVPNREGVEKSSPEILLNEIYAVCILLTQLSKERSDLLQIIPAGPQVPIGDYWERVGPLSGNLQMFLLELAQVIKEEALNSVNCGKSCINHLSQTLIPVLPKFQSNQPIFVVLRMVLHSFRISKMFLD